MKVTRKSKRLLSVLFVFLLPSHLFSQAASMPEEQPTEIQEAGGDDNRTIKGIIYDEQGETIIGASVLIKGEETGTTSDMDGKFSLEAPQGATLVISYIGYHPQEIKVRKRGTLNIILKEDNQLPACAAYYLSYQIPVKIQSLHPAGSGKKPLSFWKLTLRARNAILTS